MPKSLGTSSLVEILFRATENIGSWCWHVSLSCSATVSCGMHTHTHPTLHQGTGIFCMPLFTPAVLLGNWKSQCLLHYSIFTLQKNVLYLSVHLSDILHSTIVRCCYFASNSKEWNGNSGRYFDFFPFVCLNLFTRSLAQKKHFLCVNWRNETYVFCAIVVQWLRYRNCT